MPDLLFCDAQGYAHPRRMGLASHLGVVLDCPSIGCAKKPADRVPQDPAAKGRELDPADRRKSRWGTNWRRVAHAHRGSANLHLAGHRVSLETSIRLTLAVTDGYRIPRPTRDADHFAGEIKRKVLGAQVSEKQIFSS